MQPTYFSDYLAAHRKAQESLVRKALHSCFSDEEERVLYTLRYGEHKAEFFGQTLVRISTEKSNEKVPNDIELDLEKERLRLIWRDAQRREHRAVKHGPAFASINLITGKIFARHTVNGALTKGHPLWSSSAASTNLWLRNFELPAYPALFAEATNA